MDSPTIVALQRDCKVPNNLLNGDLCRAICARCASDCTDDPSVCQWPPEYLYSHRF